MTIQTATTKTEREREREREREKANVIRMARRRVQIYISSTVAFITLKTGPGEAISNNYKIQHQVLLLMSPRLKTTTRQTLETTTNINHPTRRRHNDRPRDE